MTENHTVDRRIVRTRLAIRDSLIILIKEKGFDALTVRDIVVRANINRGTFYLHYKDKFDLLEQTENEILKDFQYILLRAYSPPPEDFNLNVHAFPLVIELFEYVKAHADLIYGILGLQGDYSFISRIRSMAEKNLNPGILSGIKPDRFGVPQEYLVAYILHANLGVIQAWLKTGCRESPQEMAQILFRLSLDGPIHTAGLGIKAP